MDDSDRLKLADAIVHATIFHQLEPKGGDSSIYFVFERINTGGIRLSSQEIRVCLNYGPFAQLLQEMNTYPKWRQIYGPLSKRLKDQELILRFLAFYYRGSTYERPMNVFLNEFMEQQRKLDKRPPHQLQTIFTATIDVVAESIGPKAFRPISTLNAAVFDSVMVAIARRLSAGSIAKLDAIEKQYTALLKDTDYLESVTRSTADEERVANRMKLAQQYISQAK